jgi:class 3 adenylate cyclase
VCRIPSEVIDTLKALRDHGRCEACRTDFDLDFANSVELIFRAHPEVRETELGTYCIGGPAHSPHVAAQARVGPGERLALDLALAEGTYALRGPQLAFVFEFRVTSESKQARFELLLTRPPGVEASRDLRTGNQVLALTNNGAHELIVRVERTAARQDALTAARASSIALFRELFPGELLSPGQLINLATVTLVVTELAHAGDLYRELGDAQAFAILHEHFRILEDLVRRQGGAVVKTVGEGIVAVFSDPVSATAAALEMAPALARGETTGSLQLRAAVHRGSAMVAAINDRLDYFGSNVNVAMKLPALAGPGEVIASPAVATDPRVALLLQERGILTSIISAEVPGLTEAFAHRLRLPGSPPHGFESRLASRSSSGASTTISEPATVEESS